MTQPTFTTPLEQELYEALDGLVEEAIHAWEYGETYPDIAKAIAALTKARELRR